MNQTIKQRKNPNNSKQRNQTKDQGLKNIPLGQSIIHQKNQLYEKQQVHHFPLTPCDENPKTMEFMNQKIKTN